MTTVLLVRHAEAAAPNGILLGRNAEVGLSSFGLKRAARLAQHLSRLPICAVWSSPLRRAVETAEPIAKRLTLSVTISAALDEVDYGRWSGRSFAELQSDPGWRNFNTARSHAQIPDGESIESVERRVAEQLRRWTEDYRAKFLVAVTHAEIVRTALLQSLGLPSDCYEQIEISPCSVSILNCDGPRRRLTCVNESGELACLHRQ